MISGQCRWTIGSHQSGYRPLLTFQLLLITDHLLLFYSDGYSLFVRIEMLVGSHDFDGGTNALYAFASELLEGDFAYEAVEAYSAIGLGISVGGQGVVGARGIVAGTFGRVRAEEDRACVHHACCFFFRVGRLNDKVLRSILVSHFEGLVHAGHNNELAVGQ